MPNILSKAEAKLFLFILHIPGLSYSEIKKQYTIAERDLKQKSNGIELNSQLGGQSTLSERLTKLKKEGYISETDNKYYIVTDCLLNPIQDKTCFNYSDEKGVIREGTDANYVTLPKPLTEKFVAIIQKLSVASEQKIIGFIDKKDTSPSIIFEHLYNVMVSIRKYLETKKFSPEQFNDDYCEILKSTSALVFTVTCIPETEYDDCDRFTGRVAEIAKLILRNSRRKE